MAATASSIFLWKPATFSLSTTANFPSISTICPMTFLPTRSSKPSIVALLTTTLASLIWISIFLSFLHYRQFLHFKLTCCLFYPKIHYIHPFLKNKLYSTDFQNNFLDKEWVYIYNSINKWIPLKTLTGTRCKWTGKESWRLVWVSMEHCMDSSSPSFSCEVYILYM